MSYIALYRKYRPKMFKDVIGQDTTIKILRNSIIEGKIGHAYIFSGPRGTGKTSVAKIFSKAVNCLDPVDGDLCGKCKNCLSLKENDVDIIEIDAASNNGVDEIREIRLNTKLMPNIGKYKIYIIDEVHMLSAGAFNALLKTLEEPPSHVIFVLATTEIQKIPLTILSRCQRFDFHKIKENEMLNKLKEILKLENKKVEDKILKLIIKLSDGCCRDAINLLDQILSMENITENDIYDLAGDVSDDVIYDLLKFIINNDYENGLDLINNLISTGKNISNIINKMLIILRNISLSQKNIAAFNNNEKEKRNLVQIDDDKILSLTKLLLEFNIELKKSTMQKILFEIYFLQMCNIFQNENNISRKDDLELLKNNSVKENDVENIDKISVDNNLYEIRISNVLSKADKKILTDVKNKYKELDEYSSNKTFNNAVSILKDSNIVVASEEYILLAFNYESNVALYKKNIIEIEELIKLVLGKKYKTVGITSDDWNELKKEYVKDRSKFKYIKEDDGIERDDILIDDVNTVFEIFGEDTVKIK